MISRSRYGRIRRLAGKLAGNNMLAPEKATELDTRQDAYQTYLCSVRRILCFPIYLEERDGMEILYLPIEMPNLSTVESIGRIQNTCLSLLSTMRRGGI